MLNFKNINKIEIWDEKYPNLNGTCGCEIGWISVRHGRCCNNYTASNKEWVLFPNFTTNEQPVLDNIRKLLILKSIRHYNTHFINIDGQEQFNGFLEIMLAVIDNKTQSITLKCDEDEHPYIIIRKKEDIYLDYTSPAVWFNILFVDKG